MKAILIIHNKSVSEQIMYILEKLQIRGYTIWNTVHGQGVDGEPRMGTHTWPEENSAIIIVTNENKLDELKNALQFLDNLNPQIGIKAFVWNADFLF